MGHPACFDPPRFRGYCQPSTPGQVKVKRPNGEVVILAKGFWRARGLALHGRTLYLCSESDREDHGNAGQLVRIDAVTGAQEILPPVESTCGAGELHVEVFPLRRHQGSRWPMQHAGTANESPAPGFSEEPEAFRFDFSWTEAPPKPAR